MVLRKPQKSGRKELKSLSKSKKKTRRLNKKDKFKTNNNEMKIIVYGTLRKGQSNHYILKDQKYLGTFESEPIFSMYSIKNSFPALIANGNTSIKMEMYQISEEVLKKINNMEGYYENNKPISIYLKYKMVTPFGIGSIFLYNKSVSNTDKITSGDWVEYKEQMKILD